MSDFQHFIDLASERLGGVAIYATDDFFAPKENLVKPGRGEFIPGKYTENGKWMDGWESRRKRVEGHDYCILKLGAAGTLRGVDVDTNHFLGNAPESISIEACNEPGYRSVAYMNSSEVRWVEVLRRTKVQPGSQNLFAITPGGAYTHVRLHIYPDGGVARFRVYGEVVPDWTTILDWSRVVDLAAVQNGGRVLAVSDDFFSHRQNLIMPGPSSHMGDGWETKRRRGGPTHDWLVMRLGTVGKLRRIDVDTSHFKGNFPESCELEGLIHKGDPNAVDAVIQAESGWSTLLQRTKLEAHTRHSFVPAAGSGVVSHVRLKIYPDGGVARLRLWGEPMSA